MADEMSDKVTDSLVAFVTAPDARQKMNSGFFVCLTCGETANRSDASKHPCYETRPCTCLGTCRGAEGLGEGWHCVLKEKVS